MKTAVRTNYFKVKDEKKFLALIDSLISLTGVKCWHDERDGYAFGSESPIIGFEKGALDNFKHNNLTAALQECVADDDAIIIFENGNEGLRYLIHEATIITADEIREVNLDHVAMETAGEMLKRAYLTRVDD